MNHDDGHFSVSGTKAGVWVYEKRLGFPFYIAVCIPILLRRRTSRVYQDLTDLFRMLPVPAPCDGRFPGSPRIPFSLPPHLPGSCRINCACISNILHHFLLRKLYKFNKTSPTIYYSLNVYLI